MDVFSVIRGDSPVVLGMPHGGTWLPEDLTRRLNPTGQALADTCRRIDAGGWLRRGGVAYLEDAAAAGPPELPPGWTLLRSKRAGEVGYHLARRELNPAG